MPTPVELAGTIEAMRPMVPTKDFETSRRFYEELGFRPQVLTNELVEMRMGRFSFILQNYYVKEWADNFVIHVRVSDVNMWWERITSLDLPGATGSMRWHHDRKVGEWSLVSLIPLEYFGESLLLCPPMASNAVPVAFLAPVLHECKSPMRSLTNPNKKNQLSVFQTSGRPPGS
jgi:hypothetical protein